MFQTSKCRNLFQLSTSVVFTKKQKWNVFTTYVFCFFLLSSIFHLQKGGVWRQQKLNLDLIAVCMSCKSSLKLLIIKLEKFNFCSHYFKPSLSCDVFSSLSRVVFVKDAINYKDCQLLSKIGHNF